MRDIFTVRIECSPTHHIANFNHRIIDCKEGRANGDYHASRSSKRCARSVATGHEAREVRLFSRVDCAASNPPYPQNKHRSDTVTFAFAHNQSPTTCRTPRVRGASLDDSDLEHATEEERTDRGDLFVALADDDFDVSLIPFLLSLHRWIRGHSCSFCGFRFCVLRSDGVNQARDAEVSSKNSPSMG